MASTSSFKKILHKISPPKNSYINEIELKDDCITKGLHPRKLFWLCLIGSFAGVVVELTFCFIRNGYFESRSGLVYGPFNLLYGVAAVLLTVVLYPLRNKNFLWIFLVGSVVSGAFEYFCSWWQETVFHSRSWVYSAPENPLNLNGRICLSYTLMWGVLCVWLMKDLYPRLSFMLTRFQKNHLRVITLLFAVFMVFNCTVSVIAVNRMIDRNKGIPASNSIEKFVDARFPDERINRIYANAEQLND